ncbi:MAG: YicC family protein [Planctomycetaceae bacterium]|nr:YicC family protein [Planctomycetaceae bacterium]MCB9951035.1 YicC family protein [Planctomycetaceae bacterium]
MLLSMTGHGDACGQNDLISVSIEIRSVNNRHLKVSFRCPDAFLALESQVEKVIRTRVNRGSMNVSLYVQRLDKKQLNQLQTDVLEGYWEQLRSVGSRIGMTPADNLAQLLSLPGVVNEGSAKLLQEHDWPLVESVLNEAVERLQEFRAQEGANMVAELRELGGQIEQFVDDIQTRAPSVVSEYRERLKTRLADLTRGSDIQWDDKDLLREMSLFADRCDITEELSRLRSHLKQYDGLLVSEASSGRKLDFLCQEFFREVNTIGSKANDAAVSHLVLEAKAVIEKIREIVQNVE